MNKTNKKCAFLNFLTDFKYPLYRSLLREELQDRVRQICMKGARRCRCCASCEDWKQIAGRPYGMCTRDGLAALAARGHWPRRFFWWPGCAHWWTVIQPDLCGPGSQGKKVVLRRGRKPLTL